MGSWSFLTKHARALLCIAHDPGVRLRDIAAMVGITERSAHDIVSDLVEGGYVDKDKDGRRNRYRIHAHLPLGDPISQERTIGEMLDLLLGVNASQSRQQAKDPAWLTRPWPVGTPSRRTGPQWVGARVRATVP